MKTLKRYLLNVLLGVFCIVYTANAQTEVSNTVTLAQALANAYTLGGNQTITFNIPGPPPYIINTTGLNLSGGSLTSLVIDATTQPGWTAGKPVVILRGPGNGNGFNVGMSNVTIKGLIVQNFQNGYSQYNGTNNVIEGSWFGLDETGGAIAGTLNTDYGIVVHGSTSTIAIGSKTDFSATTRNVISGNGIAGVYFNGIASGSYIGNSFIGTDVTGTIELGNGTGATKTEEQHGVRINSTPSVTIKNNLISANQSGGIDVLGDKSSGLVITGNKIGTDITGNLPMGNRTFGIRIKGSNNHTIGGAGVTNRNIISANGSNDYPHEQNTSDNLKFDWYNACGIYMFNVNNSTITNNYLGVGSSGNSYTSSSAYDLGNFYVGIKIDGNSINNKVGLAGAGNIIGGNGFRSSVAAAAAGLSSLDGHGIIIKDNGTSNTSVIGNYIGVGADGTSKIGNRQDGISVQGAKGTVIGGVLATERNVIGDNVWGIFIASNYWNSQSANTVVYGNYIGVNAAGTAEIGNGTRAGDTWGGGIGVTHYSQGTLVGGAATGQGNVISGNRTGISLLGNSPITPNGNGSTTSKVYGNLVGLAANGTTVIPNIENGIYISEKATGNDIGGLLAGQANRIVGNTSSGIYSDDASANNIVGNIISNNGQIGIGLNKTINNVVRGNTITGHSASGIVLQASSSGNRFLGNTIGDLTDATKANTGDGISITASANNIIGGVSAGEGNIIANNTGNGIYIAGATSNNNSIHRNQIACNGGRGIELNAVANSNYAKPVFSGTETALVITGPAGSFIELYSLDACNNCSDLTNNKLQGRTLLTSGPSPLSYAGTVGVFYTATASAGSTTAAHNTSEFTSCYTLCPPSNLGLAVTSNSPVCVGNAAIVTITNSELGKEYQVFNGATSVSSKVIGTGANLPITLNALVANTYTLTIKVNSVGCLPTNLTQQPTVVINSSPNVGLSVTSNSPVCVGNAAIVTIVGSELNKTYEVYNGATSVSSVVTGTGGNLPITLNALTANTYTLTIRVGSGGCVTTNLTQQPTVVINSSPNVGLAVTSNSPVCVGNAAIVTIVGSELNKTYEVYNGATSVSSVVTGTGGNLPITLNALTANTYTLTIRVGSGGCVTTNLTQQPTVVINSSPNVGLAVTSNSPVCVGNAAIVTIVGSELNKTYEVYNGATSVSSVVTGTGGNLPITLNALTANTYTLTIRVGSGGCVTTNLTQQPTVVINSSPNVGLAVTSNSPVCVGNAAIVTIVGSELNKTYEVYNGATSVSSVVTGTGGNLPITLNALTANTYTLTIRVGSGGCVTTNLTQQPTVVINSSPNVGLAVTSNSPVCVGNAAIVTIVGSELNKTYEVYNGATSVSSVVTGTGGNLPITLNALTANTYTLTIRVGSGGCVTTNLTQQPTVVINSSPNVGLAVTSNSPVCVGNAAIVTIVGSELNKTYEVYNGATSVSSVVTGTGGNLPITLNALTANTYTLTIRVGSGGCVTTNLTQQPTVVINSSPNVGLAVTSNSPVCVGNAAIVTIVGSELNKTYEVYNGATSVSSVVTGTGGNLPITLNALTANTYTLTIRVGSGGCVTTNLTQQPTVVINSSPRVDSDVQTNTPICFGAQGILTVLTPEIGKSYQVFDANGVAVSPIVLSPAITALAINLNSIPVGTHTLSVRASVPGCSGIFTLTKTAPFVVNPGLNGALLLEYVPAICLGTNTSITIKNSQLNVEYQAFDDKDNAVLSSKIIGDGKDIVVNLLPLTAGDKVIYFKATIGGCGELRLGNAATIFVDTDVKKGLKATATSPICLGEKSVVTIEGSEAIKQYQVFEKGTAVSAKVKGTGIDLLIDVPNLKEGDHTFTIQVFSNGCKDDTLLQNPFTKVNSAPRTDLKVGTNGPVCAGNQAVFYIVKSEVGKKYEIFNTGTGLSVSSVAIGTGDTLKINLNNLNPGTYILSAKASSDGCASSVELIEKGTITINSIPRVDLTATVNGPVCLNAPAEVTVVKAEIGKSYQVFFKGQAVSAIGTGDGTDLKLTVTTTTMPAGIHDLAIAISVPGCTTDTLASKPKLTINKSPETGLRVSAVLSPICVNTDGAVQVFGIEPNVRYQAFIGLVDVSADLAGVGPNITLPILASKLKIGLNNISVKATISGCTSADLADTAGIVVNKEPNLGLLISADPLVICKGGESNLTIKGSELGVSYQAILSDGTTVSLSVPGNGKDTVLVVNGLPEGDNTIGVKASVAGCTDKKLNNTVLIKVNAGPKINYAVSGSTVCKGEAGFVNIDGSEIGTSYEAFNKTTNVSVSNAIPGTGAAIKIDLFPSNNPVDTIIIKANVQGCGIVRLENQAVVITNDLSTSKTLPVKGDTICTNDVSATATILGAKKGVSYQAKVGSFTSDILVGNDADLVFTILRSNLNAGNNSMSFVATVQGCQPVTLDNQALIIVNDNTTSKDLATNGDIICVNDAEGTSIIKNAIVGVSYQAKVGVTLSVVKVGDGTDLEFIFLRSDLALGSNTVSFTASIAGCSPVDLSNNATIIVNDNISSKALRTNGDSVCVNELFATATIYAAKKGVTYLAYTGSTELASKTAVDDGDIVLSISVSKLSSGNNDIIFYAEVAGCDRIELDNKAKILVIGERYVISGKKSVCAFSKHTYTVNVIPGISNYNWTLPLGAEIVAGANTNEILVKFGAKSDSIKVSPVGVVGGCDALNGSLFVTVSDTLRDTLQIKGFEKVCVRDTNWVQLDPSVVRDANIVSWKWSKTIAHYDTSNQYVYYDTTLKDTVRAYTLLSEFKIGHPTVGIDTIIVTPYEGCSESFKTSLADTLFVRVLEYPVANAGVYQDIEAERFVLNLNGTGTSVEGIAPYDSVSYKWTTDKRDLQVINPDSLNKATVELKDEKTLVTLTVMNFGKCPVTDTARVVMKSSIDIPNVFSPNGDGNHDFFEIKNLNKLYPDAVLTIFNKWGSVVYVSGAGYPEPWDGKRNGEDMPVATYYYILDTKGGRTYSPGSVTIIR